MTDKNSNNEDNEPEWPYFLIIAVFVILTVVDPDLLDAIIRRVGKF